MGTASVEGSVGGAIKMQQTQPFLEIDPSGLFTLMSKDFLQFSDAQQWSALPKTENDPIFDER